MTISDILKEIKITTQEITKMGLSIDNKNPIINKTGTKVTWENQMDLSHALKNVPYIEKYKTLEKDRNFNFKMLDGALVQMMYEFNGSGRKLISHRLAYFPSTILERYDDAHKEYETTYLVDSEFHDVREKNVIAFPIRFDYNSSEKIFREIEHPYSHATFGEYEHCRIPVNSPLTPSIFINFILRNFYNHALREKNRLFKISDERFDDTITKKETNILHFNIV
jgi:hypothetical protein